MPLRRPAFRGNGRRRWFRGRARIRGLRLGNPPSSYPLSDKPQAIQLVLSGRKPIFINVNEGEKMKGLIAHQRVLLKIARHSFQAMGYPGGIVYQFPQAVDARQQDYALGSVTLAQLPLKILESGLVGVSKLLQGLVPCTAGQRLSGAGQTLCGTAQKRKG